MKLKELGYKFSYKDINKGIVKTKWPGRLEIGKLGKINVYLDGAHNIDGASQLLRYFQKENIKVWLIIGMLRNKDLYGFLNKIRTIINGVIAVEIPNEKNCYLSKEILDVCNKLNLICFSKKSVTVANNFLIKNIKPKNILISGSLYLIGKVRNRYL